MIRVTVDEAKQRLADLIEAALDGEDVYIDVRNGHGERAIQLTNVPARPRRREFGIAKGRIWVSEDFEAPIDDFADYQ